MPFLFFLMGYLSAFDLRKWLLGFSSVLSFCVVCLYHSGSLFLFTGACAVSFQVASSILEL